MSDNEIKPVAWRWLDTCTFRKSIPKTATAGDWNPLYDQSAIDRLTAERDAAVADRDALSTMLAVAGGRLEEAANEIEDWGAYADEYFQKKHLLAEVVQSFRDDAKDAADAASAEGRA